MEVSKKLTIRTETIETLYEYYIAEKLLVNRKYQRKLVWTIEEKQSFIDSISLNYPIPLFLVAEVPFNSDTKFEIIDGMQRLNAIFAFIEGEFSFDGKFFDLDTIATTKLLKDSETLAQRLPKLERTFCKNITSYPLPLSVSKFEEHKKIEDIFTRINSNGKHLSNQELRQAASNNSFGYLVRKISESIRGDVSLTDRLLLNKMKNISINNHKLPYGIDMGGIFWKKHNIITNENIRQSRDEEMVAHLLSGMLLDPRTDATSYNLDNLYGIGELDIAIDEKIKKLSEEYIINVFQSVFDEFRKTFESTGSSFFKIVFHNQTRYVGRSFQAVFLAFYDLLVREEMKISDYAKLANEFQGFGDKYLTTNSEYLNLSKERGQAIEAIKGIARRHFTKRTQTDPALNNGVIKLENILNSSFTENGNYDFKIGFHRLDRNGQFDEACLERCLKSLTAIANFGKESVGYIIVGVADTETDKKRYESIYSAKASHYKGFYITGMNEEVSLYKTKDDYKRHLESKIKSAGITPSIYVDQIFRNMDYFKYYDKMILIMKIQAEDEPAKFRDKYYERLSSNTVEISRDKEKNLWKRFIK